MSKKLKKGHWTPEEINYLKKKGPSMATADVAFVISRPVEATKKMLSRLGIYKNLAYLKKLGRIR